MTDQTWKEDIPVKVFISSTVTSKPAAEIDMMAF